MFDVVIVGGGPVGAVMANRLSADPNRSVLLIEAGPDYGSDAADWPAEMLYAQEQPLTSHSWDLYDAGSGIFLPRAKVMGGASAVNACYWIRGSARDYDQWEALGNEGWGFDGLLPYFKMAESDPLGGPLHGTDGPVRIERAENWSPADLAFTDAAVSHGLAKVADINGSPEQIPSVGPVPKNIVDDNRFNAAMSYLAPARHRPNLTVKAETLVDHVRFSGKKAVGIILAGGEAIDADLVILAAGAYFTPGILNRSGYGNEADLASLGINVRQHLPGIGQNLHDHPFSIDVVAGLLDRRAEFGKQLQGQAMARSRAQATPDEIDCHIYISQHLEQELDRWIVGLSVSLVNTRSTGTVTLTSTDPTAPPRIEHRHYSDASDLERMGDGIQQAQAIFGTRPLADIVEPIEDRRWNWSDRK